MTAATLLIWIGLGLAALYLPYLPRPKTWTRSALKTAPLLFFAVAAWQKDAPDLLVHALLFSAFGDLALSREGDRAFLAGLTGFALAHLLYMVLFLGASGQALWDAFTLAPVPAVALVLFVLSTEFWLRPHTGRMRWPVRAYVLLIAAMGLAALTWPIGWLALGAGLFILSDFILSIRVFHLAPDHPARRTASYAVWATYIPGQLLILLAVA